MGWEAIGSICSVVVVVGGASAVLVRAEIRAAISELETRLNGKYIKADLCAAYREQREIDRDDLDRRITALEESTHQHKATA